MTAPEVESPVEREASRLKAALREVLGNGPEDLPGSTPGRTGPAAGGSAHTGPCSDESCLLCRASRAVHDNAPVLLDELARGLTVLAGATQELADGLRRHTADHPGAAEQTAAPTDEEHP